MYSEAARLKDSAILVLFVLMLGAAFFIPFQSPLVSGALREAFLMLQEYVRRHVFLCLVPALFIAGAIGNFVSQGAVIRYFGAKTNKIVSYAVASISGTVLAVCSCTVLPLFAGIYRKGAGIGPAIAFLYSGPAINVLAIILTARVLGFKFGLARAVGAVAFSVVIGLLMHLIFLKDEKKRNESEDFALPEDDSKNRPLWKTGIFFFSLVAILVFVNWGKMEYGFGRVIYASRYHITGVFMLLLLYTLVSWFKGEELKDWVFSTWAFAKQILPLLFIGVLASGFLLGRPGHEGIISSRWVALLVGGNSLRANLFASVVGALMYFATLTEVPIMQGLLGSGMGNGPGLALLLAGPALSLPSMLVIRSVVGTKKMLAYGGLVVVMSTFTGMLFGRLVP
jgi:uncharacterized membrane protein YraQ (UPF0718 family)